MTPRTKGGPSIPARPQPLKITRDFKDDRNFVPRLMPGLRLLPLASVLENLSDSREGKQDQSTSDVHNV